MRVIHLSLRDYRNYHQAEVDFTSGQNLILGRNGQGKTNLIEAVAYFATLRSHRVSSDSALIRADQPAAVARMTVGVVDRDASLEVQLNQGQSNRAQVNGNAVRPRELTRWFSAVVFAPEDLMIVRGEPALRRRFLDDGVVARNPAMSQVLSDYERVVRQRTALLKSARGRGSAQGALEALDASLSVWDAQLIELGSRIIAERRRLVDALREPLRDGYGAIAAGDHSPEIDIQESIAPDVSRETSTDDDSDDMNVSRETIVQEFRHALADARRSEVDRGVTLVGPHRDDLLLRLNHLPVKGYASHGESWSFALALRLALASVLREESAAGDPVIILDDVFAELDAERRRRLMSAVGQYEQVIVTAAVATDIFDVSDRKDEWNIIRVEAGEIVPDLETGATDGAE